MFEELAALAAVGELSALEQERLRHHLAECPQCAEIFDAFASMASNDLGVAAAAREPAEHGSLGDIGQPDAREHLARLRKRLSELSPSPQGSPQSPMPTYGVNAGRKYPVAQSIIYGIAAVLLLTVVAGGGIALWRSTKAMSAERARSHELQFVVDSLKQQRTNDRSGADGAVLRSLEESQKARDALQKSLETSETKNQELLAREKASEEKLAGAIATAEQLRQQLATNDGDRERLARLQQESDAKLHEALVELYQARQTVQTTAKDQSHEDTSLEAFEQPSADTGIPASPSEMEARNLFGARDLHIVDVYDVNGNGKTKRTYGRVYYVEKKLLVFYAFDLQKRQNFSKRLAVFQAWGYREANVGKPLNLGLFAVDDGVASRWVLTVNRPDVLSHIDAVFVTVEPPGGSTAPRGKKVLYANLVGPPNHP
jgi:hypothetical protein